MSVPVYRPCVMVAAAQNCTYRIRSSNRRKLRPSDHVRACSCSNNTNKS
jgi:hypothetical protein